MDLLLDKRQLISYFILLSKLSNTPKISSYIFATIDECIHPNPMVALLTELHES